MLNVEQFTSGDELFDGHYMLLRPLSIDGATADVWLALDTNTVLERGKLEKVYFMEDNEIEKIGLLVAIKIYRPQNALDIEGEKRFRDEYMIVFNCNHPNLIHPVHFSIFQETPYLVLPYCKLGSSELLVGNQLREDNIWKFIYDVSSGLAYLHAQKPPIVHQDIKPANILQDDTYHYAITDFGISSQKGGTHGEYFADEENSGTMAYMAPERFQEGCEPMAESDIWAFGATLCEILTGRVPYGEKGGLEQHDNGSVPILKDVPENVVKLIHSCLAIDPKKRPTAEQLAKTAEAKLYPVKSKKWIYGGLVLFFFAILICGTYLFSKPDTEIVIQQPTFEEQFSVALGKMNCDNTDSLKEGIKLLDSLSKKNYIPAMYEMAFTYGWYRDSISVKRKELLGISTNETNLPTSTNYSIIAVGLFTRIMALNDSSYADINSKVAYSKACYFINENNLFKMNVDSANSFLNYSERWAILAGDNDMLLKIKKAKMQINSK